MVAVAGLWPFFLEIVMDWNELALMVKVMTENQRTAPVLAYSPADSRWYPVYCVEEPDEEASLYLGKALPAE